MSPSSISLLSLLLTLFLVSTTGLNPSTTTRGGGGGGGGRRVLVGGWQPIGDLKSKNVVEIAEFAVAEHNKKANSKLMFGGVVMGEQQVVSGMNYRLYIKAKDGRDLGNYVAVVYDKPWQKLRSLTSFEKVG